MYCEPCKQNINKIQELEWKLVLRDREIKKLKDENDHLIVQLLDLDYCEGCVWEKDIKNCPNDYKNEMETNKFGRLVCGYCAWFKSKGEGQ